MRMRPRTTTHVAVALAMVLAACGGGADPAADDATATTADDDTADDMADDMADDDMADDEMDHADDEMDHADDEMDHADDEMDHADDVSDGVEADVTIAVEMRDIAFSIDELEVAAGETVRFVFTNVGEAEHEALVGDIHLQEEHEDEMVDMDDMHHGDMAVVSVDPGGTAELVHTFDEPGELWIGCHVPGHWPAGMKIRVTVT